MRILFNTKHTNEASTELNTALLRYLNTFKDVRIDFFNSNYHEYDVVLFMGYDPEIEKARKANPKVKIGVIDPRPPMSNQPIGADFILANGLEMKDWYSKYTENIFLYYIYPPLSTKGIKTPSDHRKVIIGYHGNKVHLTSMSPRITKAMEMLADEHEIEFWAMYNIEKLGLWDSELERHPKIKVKHIQWSEHNYIECISKVDIGIVPGLIPTYKTKKPSFQIIKKWLFNEHESDYLLAFKATSNAGRIIVFAQLGIPVIADMYPSALQFIEDGINGFVCYSTDAWYLALKRLAGDNELRHAIASNMKKKFDETISPEVLNSKLIEFIKTISFPLSAIQYCLEAGNVRSEELDILAIPTTVIQDAFFSFFTIGEANVSGDLRKLLRKNLANGVYSSPSAPVLPLYQRPFVLSEKCKIELVEHHLAHAASACYTSGLYNEKALVVTLDGVGDGVSTAIWRFEKNRIEKLQQYDASSSLGWFYANATEALEWRHGSDEWKVMGLAPYGVPHPGALKGYHPEFKEGILVKGHGYGNFGRWNDHGANHYHGKDALALNKIAQKLGREDFSAEVQRVVEEQAFNLILPWLEREKTRHLLCAGGFFLNVKFNQKLWYKDRLDTQWIYPNCGDSGLPVGAALYVYYMSHPEKRHVRLTDLYSGPQFSNEEIKKILEDRGVSYRYVENPSEEAAKYLTKNYVLGWFQGRMEAGPRALGNRSILMSPLRAENKDLINKKIKYREPFRPFCPSMLYEKQDYLINPRDERFMVTSFDVKEEKKGAIPAVIHIDGTARPQMVKREINPRYYDLIMAFGNLTGEYVILNTSFNIKGEPIVCNPREAIKCFYDTGIDVLIMNNFVIEKPNIGSK
ncbi:MAG: hypothetical protein HY753_02105 [Nitrospirae bacterium]|nr:hypothetical protein [Nitrospirota bacterium]